MSQAPETIRILKSRPSWLQLGLKALLAVVLLLTVSVGWFAANPISDWYIVPEENEILIVIGQAESTKSLNRAKPAAHRELQTSAYGAQKLRCKTLNPENIRVLVWNMQKSAGEDWATDFLSMTDRCDLAILQEFLLTTHSEKTYDKTRQTRWDFATAFIEKESGAAAGVATGSIANPSKVEFRRAPVNEPFTQTPKMTLITRYPLANTPNGRHELLVANIHAINFRSEGSFSRQLNDLMDSLREHPGPVIFAGDFNTWSDDRMDELEKITARAGLSRVEFAEGRKGFMGNVLDHAFVRGLRILSSTVRTDVESSDHRALEMELKFEPDGPTEQPPMPPARNRGLQEDGTGDAPR
jgi:endonuclease/exonuclease/phosphatase (EEP) superfamily protein YafD